MSASDLQPIINPGDSTTNSNFKSIDTIFPITLQLLFATALEITCVTFAICEPMLGNKCESYFIILYLVCAHWFISIIIDHILKSRHYEAKINGYFKFNKSISNHHRLPFYIISLWTVVLFIVQTLIQHFYFDNLGTHCIRADFFTPLNYVTAFITLEYVVLVTVIVTYIWKIYKFNKTRPLPDVQKEEWNTTLNRTYVAQGEIGYAVETWGMNDVLERQAELIEYLTEHNARLNEKIMILTARLRL